MPRPVMVLLFLLWSAAAVAQPDPGGLLVPPTETTAPPPSPATGPAWASPPAPGSRMRQPERLSHRPSGFWTSTRPAQNGAYRYRLLLVGIGVLIVSVVGMVVIVRHARGPRGRRVSAG